MNTEVELTKEEICVAGLIGLLEATSRLEPHWRNDPELSWGVFIESTGARMAVAKLMGLYPDFASGRVGGLLVRHGNAVYGSDEDTEPIVFVHGWAPTYTVQGWQYAHEAKRKEYFDARKWVRAYMASDEAMRPLADLPERHLADEGPRTGPAQGVL